MLWVQELILESLPWWAEARKQLSLISKTGYGGELIHGGGGHYLKPVRR
jgi:hypothetical protein